jgi:arylformamidase
LIIDLTMPLRDGMPAFPGEPSATFTPFTTIAHDRVAMSSVAIFSQLGTHLDAPAHFIDGGTPVDQLDLERCVGAAVVIRLGEQAPGSIIEAADLDEHSDSWRSAERVILDTGWSRLAGTGNYFTEWPCLSMAAARRLHDAGVRFLGLDTPSPGDDASNVELHQILLADDGLVAECLVNVHRLPDHFTLICLPLPLVGLDGSPVRAIALTDDTDPVGARA